MASRSALSALAMTSRQKRSIAPCVCPLRLSQAPTASPCCRRDGPQHGAEGAGQGDLVGACECLCARAAWAGHAAARAASDGPSCERRPPGSIMVISLRPVNLLFDADAAVEADEIGAAAEEHVLAVVDDFVDAGMQIGRCAAAEIAATLDELHAIAGLGQGTGRAHAGHAAADHGDGGVFAVVVFLRANSPQGLKTGINFAAVRARLKSCPDTSLKSNCRSFDLSPRRLPQDDSLDLRVRSRRQPCNRHAGHSNGQNARPLYCRNARALRKHIVIRALDAAEQSVINRHQHPQRGAAFAIDQRQQLVGGGVVRFGALADLGQQCALVRGWRSTLARCRIESSVTLCAARSSRGR